MSKSQQLRLQEGKGSAIDEIVLVISASRRRG